MIFKYIIKLYYIIIIINIFILFIYFLNNNINFSLFKTYINNNYINMIVFTYLLYLFIIIYYKYK